MNTDKILSLNGTLIDLTKIYAISDIIKAHTHEPNEWDDEDDFIDRFIIYFLNNNKITIYRSNSSIGQFIETRRKLVNHWSMNQHKITNYNT